MDKNIVKLFSRLRNTADGIELLDYLKKLSSDNYEAFKKDESAADEIHKGYAIAIDSLIKLFEVSDELLHQKSQEYIKEHY